MNLGKSLLVLESPRLIGNLGFIGGGTVSSRKTLGWGGPR